MSFWTSEGRKNIEDKDPDVWNREARRKVDEFWFHWPEHVHKVEKEGEKLRGNTPRKRQDEACNQDYVIWQATGSKSMENCQNESAAFESDFWTLTDFLWHEARELQGS